jgi:thymidylate synthase (FAD)
MKIELIRQAARDIDVVNAARVSFDKQVYKMGDADEKLIGFLLKNKHGTPFEHGYLRFHVEAPIFVFREWHRHRAGHSYNEMSGRYVELPRKFYRPKTWRKQVGKPGNYTYVDMGRDAELDTLMESAYIRAWSVYQDLLAAGVAKEQARAVLPVGTYSQMFWSCNPRSFMHFLSLRNAPNAMKEIRDLAEQAEKVFATVMPVTHKAFVDNGRIAP